MVGVDESRVSVVYLAAGEEFSKLSNKEKLKSDLRKKYNLPPSFALYVGDATWNKNIPRIIEAAIKASVPLVLVGKAIAEANFDKGNPWNKDLNKVQSLINDNKNIITLGFVPTTDLVGLYNCANLCVMPSLYEGFGLPVLEAMQCGCPVITSREGSLPEVAGEAAYYVDAYSAEAIAEGIKKVFEDSLLRASLSKKGVRQAEKFSWKKTAEKTMDAYKTIK